MTIQKNKTIRVDVTFPENQEYIQTKFKDLKTHSFS